MEAIHQHEKRQFKRLFEQEGIDRVDDRLTILHTFLGVEHHISFQELMDMLAKEGRHFEPELVKDTLDLLCRYGFALETRFSGQPVLYEHRHLGLHHDHLICTKCNKIVEFQDRQMENMQLEIAAGHGFHVLQHRMEIYGLCPACRRERISLIPLSQAREGERALIEELTSGVEAEQRLATMGLRRGDEIEIITNTGHGQMVIAVDATRFALGRGIAQKILVKSNGHKTRRPTALNELKQGQTATVVRIGGSGPFRRRLLEMGFLRGADVYVEKYAPLKDPIELILKGCHVSLRVEEAANVEVQDVRDGEL